MKTDIEKAIQKDVEDALAEIDLDSIIKRYTNSKSVKNIVEQMVKEKIAQTFQEKILIQYRKREMIIDAWADIQLTSLLIKLGIK